MVIRPSWILLVAVMPVVAEDAPANGARLLHEWTMGNAAVRAVQFADDDTAIAVDIAGGAARLGEGVHALPKTRWPGLTCGVVAREPGAAFVGLPSGAVWRWDLATGKRDLASSGHASTVACVALSPDGRLVATGS